MRSSRSSGNVRRRQQQGEHCKSRSQEKQFVARMERVTAFRSHVGVLKIHCYVEPKPTVDSMIA
jgi:diadenosine tetraphosphate (Ap4A) HIT family hydrolase